MRPWNVSFAMEPDDYAAAFRGSAIKRAKLPMLKRNAEIVLSNLGPTHDESSREPSPR